MESRRPVINCHTHIFTGNHVPPWLGRTFLLWPFYYLIPVSSVVGLLRWWYDGPYTLQFKPGAKNLKAWVYRFTSLLDRFWILGLLTTVIGLYLSVHCFFILFDWINGITPATWLWLVEKVKLVRNWLKANHIINDDLSTRTQIFFVLLMISFFKPGRNVILYILMRLWKVAGASIGKQSRQLAQRYLLLGRYTRYKNQSGIFSKLSFQYPEGTGFIVLPMDMEFMGAGRLKPGGSLYEQMDDLSELKRDKPDTIFPFVFADPRRMEKEPNYFQYTIAAEGKVILSQTCHISRWLVTEGFNGIKIYPALGYFPFDENLLLLWKYAADHQIPIITHCIRGTIFYRGLKRKEWYSHPLFKQAMGNEQWEPLLLPERENVDFSYNFTHPLNYLCLLEETFLRQLIEQTKKPALRADLEKAFGYTDSKTPLQRDLKNLRICFGHFGGDDEWSLFQERDRDEFGSLLQRKPNRGIEFLYNEEGPDREPRPGKIEQIWKYADWYTIICSLILQYPNVYADISYILHEEKIFPLLKGTLQHSSIRHKVLYGTDFYVVRNHKSDKRMLSEFMAGLSEDEFDLIARDNPHTFLFDNTLIKSKA